MVLLYMVTWIPSIYPSHVSIYTSTMDPMGDDDVSFEDGYISELYKFFFDSSPCWIRMKTSSWGYRAPL